jgi:uncharacterized protein YjgD (DUF1641 family)
MSSLVSLNNLADQLVSDIPKLANNINETNIPSYTTLCSTAVLLVLYTERANCADKHGAKADSKKYIDNTKDHLIIMSKCLKDLNAKGYNKYEDCIRGILGPDAKKTGSLESGTIVIGSSDKKYLCGQRISQFKKVRKNAIKIATDMKADNKYVLDVIGVNSINELVDPGPEYIKKIISKTDMFAPYNLLINDITSLIQNIVMYISRYSKNKSAAIVDQGNSVALKIDTYERILDYRNISDVMEGLREMLDIIHEIDVDKVRQHIETLKEATDNKEKIKEYLSEIRTYLTTSPSLCYNRHKVKTELRNGLAISVPSIGELTPEKLPKSKDNIYKLAKKRIDSDEKILDKLEKYENNLENIVNKLNDAVNTFSYFISFNQKDTCINHCLRVVELLVIPNLIGEKKLSEIITKTYKINMDISESGIKKFVDDHC